MGVVNVTPDSFSDGGKYFEAIDAIAQARQLFTDGAAIVDIGSESTRPGAEQISIAEEWRRIQPVLAALLPEYPGQISVDTRHAEIIKKALGYDIEFIFNDVTTFHDLKMIELAVQTGYLCIVSHLPFWAQGNIEAAHMAKNKLVDSVGLVKEELLERRDQMIAMGVKPNKIILDPGIGFGKTPELNAQLVRFAEEVPGLPVLIGYSQKRFLGEDKRYDKKANLALGKIAKASGARYIRVHDVRAHASLL